MRGPLFHLEHIGTGRVIIDAIPAAKLVQIQVELSIDGCKKISLSGKSCRILRHSNGIYRIYALATDPDIVKSNRLLKSESEMMLKAAENVDREIQTARKKAENQTRRLIHNLKSLTAKTVQEIYYIALQDKLMASPKDSLSYLEREISLNPKEVAKALLAILKYQTAQKTEFSAFHKLNGDVGIIKKEPHKVHKVLMNIFYLFFNDFTDKKVLVDVQHSEIQGYFDYDSIHVCVYHLVENAAKYIKNGGNFSVLVTRSSATVDIAFEMESLQIKPDEVDKIFKEDFSGQLACGYGLNGSGIGLYLAKQMARLNGGDLVVLNGPAIQASPDYARNKFTLSLPLTNPN